jgi:hypothetical protein
MTKKPCEIVGAETCSILAREVCGFSVRLPKQVCHCVETRYMRAVLQAQINKTDRNDARGIAQIMRADFIARCM